MGNYGNLCETSGKKYGKMILEMMGFPYWCEGVEGHPLRTFLTWRVEVCPRRSSLEGLWKGFDEVQVRGRCSHRPRVWPWFYQGRELQIYGKIFGSSRPADPLDPFCVFHFCSPRGVMMLQLQNVTRSLGTLNLRLRRPHLFVHIWFRLKMVVENFIIARFW